MGFAATLRASVSWVGGVLLSLTLPGPECDTHPQCPVHEGEGVPGNKVVDVKRQAKSYLLQRQCLNVGKQPQDVPLLASPGAPLCASQWSRCLGCFSSLACPPNSWPPESPAVGQSPADQNGPGPCRHSCRLTAFKLKACLLKTVQLTSNAFCLSF